MGFDLVLSLWVACNILCEYMRSNLYLVWGNLKHYSECMMLPSCFSLNLHCVCLTVVIAPFLCDRTVKKLTGFCLLFLCLFFAAAKRNCSNQFPLWIFYCGTLNIETFAILMHILQELCIYLIIKTFVCQDLKFFAVFFLKLI